MSMEEATVQILMALAKNMTWISLGVFVYLVLSGISKLFKRSYTTVHFPHALLANIEREMKEGNSLLKGLLKKVSKKLKEEST